MSASEKSFEQLIKDDVGPGGRNLYFNNAGLFDDPFLEKLPTLKTSYVLSNWDTEPLPAFSETYEWMMSKWAEEKTILEGLNEAQLEERWIRPILKKLGWEFEVQDRLKKHGKTDIPDYSLFESEKAYRKAAGARTDEAYFDQVIAIADAKKMNSPLDGSKMDNSNPSYQIIWYQQVTGKGWGILTDGRYWRLYSKNAKSKYNVFYEVNVEKFLYERNDALFKYFFNFFRKEAFVPDENTSQSFLDFVFESGDRYAGEVESKLKFRAFKMVEGLCRGFGRYFKNPSQDDLDHLYSCSLHYLFRLMFVLNCEAKGLLNVHKQSDYYIYSLRYICARIREEYDANTRWSSPARSFQHIDSLFHLLKNGDSKIGIHGFGDEPFIGAYN